MSAAKPFRTAPVPRVVTAADKPDSQKSSSLNVPWRRIGIYVVLALGFFLLGAVPMWLRARQNATEREAAQHELRLSRLENQLMAAVIDARRADYEPARQTASDFFTSLRNQIDRGGASDLTEPQRADLKTLLVQRDDIISLLARDDPAAADRLSNLYATYRKTMSDVPKPVAATRWQVGAAR